MRYTSLLLRLRSSKGKVAEKEHIVPLIQKNVWRQPTGKRLARDSRTQGTQKSEEEVALDKEAAEAIIKGAHLCQCSVCWCPSFKGPPSCMIRKLVCVICNGKCVSIDQNISLCVHGQACVHMQLSSVHIHASWRLYAVTGNHTGYLDVPLLI